MTFVQKSQRYPYKKWNCKSIGFMDDHQPHTRLLIHRQILLLNKTIFSTLYSPLSTFTSPLSILFPLSTLFFLPLHPVPPSPSLSIERVGPVSWRWTHLSWDKWLAGPSLNTFEGDVNSDDGIKGIIFVGWEILHVAERSDYVDTSHLQFSLQLQSKWHCKNWWHTLT